MNSAVFCREVRKKTVQPQGLNSKLWQTASPTSHTETSSANVGKETELSLQSSRGTCLLLRKKGAHKGGWNFKSESSSQTFSKWKLSFEILRSDQNALNHFPALKPKPQVGSEPPASLLPYLVGRGDKRENAWRFMKEFHLDMRHWDLALIENSVWDPRLRLSMGDTQERWP